MSEAASPTFWQRLGQIPRGYIYGILAAVVVWQLVWPITLPVAPSAQTMGVLEAIQTVPVNKLVIISADWDASTQAETAPQTEAVMRALFRAKKPFAILNLATPAGVQLAQDLGEKVAKEYGAKYGVDWVNWGYKFGSQNVVMGLARNIPAAVGADFRGASLKQVADHARPKGRA